MNAEGIKDKVQVQSFHDEEGYWVSIEINDYDDYIGREYFIGKYYFEEDGYDENVDNYDVEELTTSIFDYFAESLDEYPYKLSTLLSFNDLNDIKTYITANAIWLDESDCE
jgi:hypothetical protein